MELLLVMPPIVLDICRSRESSMMGGVFCSICRPDDDDVFGCGSGMLISVPLSLLVGAVGCGIASSMAEYCRFSEDEGASRT